MDDDQARQTNAFAVKQILVDATWVDTDTLLEEVVVVVSLFAGTTDSIDGVKSRCTVTISCVWVEYLVESTSVAFGLVTILDLYGWFAVDAVL